MQKLKYIIGGNKRALVKDVQNFKIDFNTADVHNFVQARQYENTMRQVFVDLVNDGDGSPYDLTGANIMFEGTLPDNTHKIMDAKHGVILDPQNGQFRFDFPKQAFAVAGSYTQAFFRIMRDGDSVTTLEFDLEVLADKVISGLIPADYITPFEDIYDEMQALYKKAGIDLEEFKKKWEQIYQDVLDKWTEKYSDISRLVKLLQTELDAIKSSIETNNVVTEPELNNAINDAIAKLGTAQPNFVDSLDDLKSKYPNGANGIYVTLDSGIRYVYQNGAWKDIGPYQAVGLLDGSVLGRNIADKTIQDANIGTINLTSVFNSYAFIGNAVQWNDGLTNDRIYFDKGNVAYVKTDDTKKDSGIAFPISLPHFPYSNKPVYIHLSYYTANAETMDDQIDIWLAGVDGTLIKQIFSGDKKGHTLKLVLTQDDFTKLSMSTDFMILVVGHGGSGVLDVKDLRVNFSETEDALPESIDKIYNITSDQVKELNTSRITNTLVDLTKYSRWGSGGEDNIKATIEGSTITYQQLVDGDCGVVLPINNYPNSRDLFVSFASSISGATNVGEEIYLLKPDGKLIMDSATKLNNNYNLADHAYRFSAANMRKWGITDQFYILFVTHKKGARLVISDLNVGVTNGNANLNDTINNVLNAAPLRKTEKIGQIINDQNIDKFTPTQIDDLQFVTYNAASTDNNILKKIYAYVTKSGVYTFETGIIDQNGLIMNANPFQITMTAGYNEVDVENKGIKVAVGQRLFMNLDIDNYVYVPKNSADKYIPTLLQDKNHNSTNPNYPGMIMYDGGTNMVPFAYDLIQQSKMDELSNHVDEVDQDVTNLKLSKGPIILTKPSGERVYVGVDDTGLFFNNIIPNKVTFIGNSITVEDGHGSIGMAASDKDHDYYALVSKWITDQNSSAEIQPRFTCAGWEGATTSAARQDFFDKTISPKISEDTDLVIVQLIDNVNTDEKLATFEKDAENLIRNIRTKAPHARVLWVAGWFVNDSKMQLVKQACDQAGATLVDITKYKDDTQYKSYIGAKRTGIDGTEMTVTEAGVAAHPGDLGMQMIRDEIVKTITG